MTQQEQFIIYLEKIHDSCVALIQLWDTRDVNSVMAYAPMIKKLVEIEKILNLVKVEMVEDASKLG